MEAAQPVSWGYSHWGKDKAPQTRYHQDGEHVLRGQMSNVLYG